MEILLSFIGCLILISLVGLAAIKKSKSSTEDYLLAGRDIGPIPMALSAASSKISGFMFIGMVGYTYLHGLSSIWLLLGWILGDYLIWKLFYKKIREESERTDCMTITAFAASDKSGKLISRKLLVVLSSLVLVFMTLYASAQLNANAKALESLLNLSPELNILIGAAIIALYCLFGGIRADVWTDTAQSVIMLVAMGLLAYLGITACDGFSGLINKLKNIDPNLLKLIPKNLEYGFILFFISRLANGLALLGQPHVIVRAMLIKKVQDLRQAEWVYFSYYISFCIAMFLVALSSRAILPNLISGDPEQALPELSLTLLPKILVGVVLAGIFSSTISTADSQVLACTSCLTQDIFTKLKDNYLANKLITLGVLSTVTVLALNGNRNVFDLTMLGWSSLGAIFVPLIIIRLLKIELSPKKIICILSLSLLSSLLWRFCSLLNSSIDDTLIAFLTAFISTCLIKLYDKSKVSLNI